MVFFIINILLNINIVFSQEQSTIKVASNISQALLSDEYSIGIIESAQSNNFRSLTRRLKSGQSPSRSPEYKKYNKKFFELFISESIKGEFDNVIFLPSLGFFSPNENIYFSLTFDTKWLLILKKGVYSSLPWMAELLEDKNHEVFNETTLFTLPNRGNHHAICLAFPSTRSRPQHVFSSTEDLVDDLKKIQETLHRFSLAENKEGILQQLKMIELQNPLAIATNKTLIKTIEAKHK